MNNVWWVSIGDLDDQQKAAMNIASVGRYLISGPPGSGKTNLLILRAKFLEKSNIQNFAVITFNGTLARFLRTSSIAPEKIHSAISWLESKLWELSGQRAAEIDFQKKREEICNRLKHHLDSHQLSGLIHTLLVDEIQDYTLDEIELFVRMATNVYFVGDARQKIYSSDFTIATAMATHALTQINLPMHYRLGSKICELADLIATAEKGHSPISDSCFYDERKSPSSVDVLCLDLYEQASEIVKRCLIQIDAFPGEFIGILCPTNSILSTVRDKLEPLIGEYLNIQSGDEHSSFHTDRPVILTTMHSGKGLEFRCVHIVDANALKKLPRSRELIYTSVTRAKTSVTIYHSSALNDFLADALTFMDGPPPEPRPESLF